MSLVNEVSASQVEAKMASDNLVSVYLSESLTPVPLLLSPMLLTPSKNPCSSPARANSEDEFVDCPPDLVKMTSKRQLSKKSLPMGYLYIIVNLNQSDQVGSRGRTGNVSEYYKVQNDEQIKYNHIRSLYPAICKYGKFPVGHPKVYVGDECPSLTTVSRVVNCSVLPL
ncbi:unnamed protein product [Psylliodes chrysocephalus]|uniref:Uncharacterized protein n=1 Tax=Psylliodes chrysocephalus TaxID=3402493 RepID=A0A9P0GEN7_9CUCU|nr:unnamed protein product [Psylliodes chrysocephala]